MEYTKENFIKGSYKGKDLLEATNMSPKASLEFKDIMLSMADDRTLQVLNNNNAEISKSIKEFALFIYGNEERADFFTEKVLIAML